MAEALTTPFLMHGAREHLKLNPAWSGCNGVPSSFSFLSYARIAAAAPFPPPTGGHLNANHPWVRRLSRRRKSE